MKYFVTFCAMDGDVDANMFWHSCLLLSRKEMDITEVVGAFGFYGLPTTAPKSWKRDLKIQLSLDVDLEGNHGMLMSEPLRRLDAGKGLHGVTFELTPENFNELASRCNNMISAQEAAIAECVNLLGIETKKEKKFRVYPFERYSQAIYEKELALSKARGTPPRLEPFELILSWGLGGPALTQSSTCKSAIIKLLTGLLTPMQIDRLTEKGSHPTVPRFSGSLEPLCLFSTGPLKTHARANGQLVSYRDWGEGVKLFWAVPPQELEALTTDTREMTALPQAFVKPVKIAVSQLQQLEWYLRDVSLPTSADEARLKILDQIIHAYQLFTLLPTAPERKLVNGALYTIYGFFNWPKSMREQWCEDNLKFIETYTNAWADNAFAEYPELTVFACLSFEDKLKFCKILGLESELLANVEPLFI